MHGDTAYIQFATLISEICDLGDGSPGTQVDRIAGFYHPILFRNYENPEPRENDIEYLGLLAAGYKSRRQFLADLILDPPISTGDWAGIPTKDEDWLILSTIHSAKGLEWDVVYLIHATDGCLPSDMATGSDREIEEELRLAYVAMTRARDSLYVLWPQRYYLRPFGFSDRHSYAQCSRFFTDKVLCTMEERMLGRADKADDSAPSLDFKGDIARRIRYMWE